MNINSKIFTATDEELTSYALFHDIIKVMKATDGVEPAGACCGKNTKQIINSFITNKQKYFNFMENIKNRLIKPLRKGVVYISPMKKMLNYALMTDKEIITCVKKGYLSKNLFDWTEYEKARNTPEQIEEPKTEEPVEEPTTDEPKTEEPVDEPVVETPKKSSRKSKK